jgi:hypothetical protein
MNHRRRDGADHLYIQSGSPAAERCNCLPISSIQVVPSQDQEENGEEYHRITPASPALNILLRQQLESFFPRSTPLSLLLLHISQLEHININPQSGLLSKRQRYHAAASFLDQVLVNVRRAIRESDEFLAHEGTGAAIIFPEVDKQGISVILERVSHSIGLLQAETVVPPLKRETDIVLGTGSYPESGPSLEHLLYHVGITAHRFTLRPALTAQLWGVMSTMKEIGEPASLSQPLAKQKAPILTRSEDNIPFMQLPAQLSSRLKQLIPYRIALELRCVPVGRDHQYLTVAMADPSNNNAVHALREITGLTVFPVSCDILALNALLASKW